jgi:spore germination protein KC
MVKKVKILLLSLLAAILIFNLSGCWNYIDINELFVVEGFAVDKDKETGEYILIYEVAKAKSESEKLSVKVSSVRGITIYQAIRDAIHEIGSKLYWGHASVCIIGKNVAEEGIVSILDTISRSTEIKPSILICYSETENLEDLFNVEDPIHDSVTQHIRDLFEENTSSGKFISAPMIDVVKSISSETPAFLLPKFELEDNGDEKELIIKGSATFKKDKYLGDLDYIESRSINIMRNEVKSGYMISLNNNAFPNVTVEVVESKLKLNPIIKDNKPRMEIELKLDCRLIEIMLSEAVNVDDIEHGIKSSFKELLVQQLGSVIQRAQNEKVDYIGFSKYFSSEQPKYWDDISGKWDEVFPTMSYKINVRVDILGRGAIREPLEIEE